MAEEKKAGFTDCQKQELLNLGLSAIETYLQTGQPSEINSDDPELAVKAAVFVTLRIGNHLRGCIGQIHPELPLYLAVQNAAISAAFSDPRFPPLSNQEIPDLRIKIAMLSPLEPIEPDEIEVGKHGLLIIDQGKRGLLLPEVASERGWDKYTFLENLCAKARLPSGAWKDAQLLGFTTEIIE